MILDLFRGRERWYLGGVLLASLVAAFFETIGVASILPFMALVLDPTALERYHVFQSILRTVGVTTTRGGLLVVGSVTVVVVALGNLAAAANLYVQFWFTGRSEARLSAELFAGYLRQPYKFHTQRDAPSLLKVLNADVRSTLDGFITPMLAAASRLLMILGVLALLLLQDAAVAVTVAGVLTVTYCLIFYFVRRRQRILGVEFTEANENRARISQEGLAGFKEMKVLGREDESITGFAEQARRSALPRAINLYIGSIPKYVIEPVAFGGILIATLALVAHSGESSRTVVPILALYAFAGYRLLPAFQQIFFGAVAARFYVASLRSLHADYVTVVADASRQYAARDDHKRAVSASWSTLRLENVTFTYEGVAGPTLRDVTLTIHPNESVGLVGRTGSGKTTLADVILGLYEPDSGRVSLDGIALTGGAIHDWQKLVGYVPQHVFLSNASVSENIAFGIPKSQIDHIALQRAARLAQAEEFILALPYGYETFVGERGVRLSGGQQQRLGIARALYHEPSVLVFDEATSALDGLTEDFVMEAIRSLAGDRTIILIAHRLRTVEACDRIVLLDQGRVVADGKYRQLFESSDAFRRLVARSATPAA